LGTIFYHLLTGRFPYSLEGSPESCVESIRRAIPRPPSALNPKVPPALNTLVLRALDKDPTKRFQDAEELGRELELLSPRARISPPSSRRKLTPIIGGAVALLAGVAALAFAMSREQPAPMQVNVATSATTVPLSDQRVRKYSPTQLATLAAPTSAVAAVPKALWPVYRQALDDVQNVEEHRLSGALLVDVRALQKGGSVRLRSVQGSEQIEETSFAPGDSLIILVPAGHTYILECVTPDGIVKFKAAITSGEVIYWQPKPNAPDPKVKASAV
jgi:serine/threonine protein kinase